MGEVGSHLKKVAFRINPQVMYLLDWVFTLEVRIQDNFRKKKNYVPKSSQKRSLESDFPDVILFACLTRPHPSQT